MKAWNGRNFALRCYSQWNFRNHVILTFTIQRTLKNSRNVSYAGQYRLSKIQILLSRTFFDIFQSIWCFLNNKNLKKTSIKSDFKNPFRILWSLFQLRRTVLRCIWTLRATKALLFLPTWLAALRCIWTLLFLNESSLSNFWGILHFLHSFS